MKKRLLLTATLLVAMITTGCGSIEETVKKGSASIIPMEEQDKYNAYVSLFNAMTGELAEAEKSYSESQMDESGNFLPADAQNSTYISSLGRTKTALEKSEEAASSKPKMEIDKDTKELITVLKEEVEIFEELKSYYDEKDYITDDNKKGKELHDKLLASYKKVSAPSKAFHDKMQALMDKKNKEERKENEKKGNKISLALNDFIDAVDKASDTVTQNTNEDGSITLTAENYKQANTKVSETFDALKTASKDKETLKKEGYNENSFELFMNKASEFKSCSNELYGSFSKEDLEDEEKESIIEDFLNTYSRLIDSYNSWIAS